MPSSIPTFETGARCLAGPSGFWAPGAVRRVNEDGTYSIELDEKELIVIPHWDGVTHEEISTNEASLWPEVFARLTSGEPLMRAPALADALKEIWYHFDGDVFAELWASGCEELLGIGADTASAGLTEAQAYQMLLRLGGSAKLANRDRAEPNYYKLYWNQLRMGGRRPSDVSRAVTVEDAFQAIGIERPVVHYGAVRRLARFQRKNDVELPAQLHRFLSCAGIVDAVADCHGNNPTLVNPGEKYVCSELQRSPPLENRCADFGMTIMLPTQGADFVWAAVFNRGDADAKIYVAFEDHPWKLTAPSIGMFFWDLAQTGLVWYQDTGHDGGREIVRTDIGIAPKHALWPGNWRQWFTKVAGRFC